MANVNTESVDIDLIFLIVIELVSVTKVQLCIKRLSTMPARCSVMAHRLEVCMAWCFVRPAVLAFIVVLPFAAWAQGPAQSSNPPSAISNQPLLKPEEVEALVAPIAL